MFLSNAFTHDSRVYAEARSLIKADHSVTVIARDRERIHPRKDILDEINIERVRPLPSLEGNKFIQPFKILLNGMNLLLTQWQMFRCALKLHKGSA